MKLCGTTIKFYVWGTHLPKKVKHGKNVLVFHVLRIYAGKNRKTKNVGTWGPGAPTFLRFSFFEIFFSKFVKCKKLYIFWHGYLFLRVNEWLGQWWLLLIFIPYSLIYHKMYHKLIHVKTPGWYAYYVFVNFPKITRSYDVES